MKNSKENNNVLNYNYMPTVIRYIYNNYINDKLKFIVIMEKY